MKRKRKKIKLAMLEKELKEKTKREERSFERIPSGIKNLDKLIQGGIEKNSINLVVGGSGTGKTIFAVQFLVEGMKRGESVLYITFEEKKDEFYNNMLKFGWDLRKYEKKGKFFFLEYDPEKVRTMLEEGGGTVESLVLKNSVKRIVIDSITSFALLFDEELAKREAALDLFDMIRKWQCTSILTLQEEAGKKRDGYSSSLEFESDSIILLYFARRKTTRQRFVEVLKMRGTKHSTSIYPFDIGKNGIILGKQVLRDGLDN